MYPKKVSIVSIAKNKSELEPLREALKRQTYKKWEFVYSTKNGIPHAWNDAIHRAKGDILIFTESDALPLNDRWIEDMANALEAENEKWFWKKHVVIRGIEITPTPWCLSNVAIFRDAFKNLKFNEAYPIAEDTELFTKLHASNYIGRELPIAPVVHARKFKGFRKEIKNAYLYGFLNTRTRKKYLSIGFDQKIDGGILKREFTTVVSRFAYLLGIMRGLL